MMKKNQDQLLNDSLLLDTNVNQSVRVSDGMTSFTFEVPEDWIVETRNDGEKQMSEAELREFLATSYRSDAKQFPDKQVSDYAHLTWTQLQKMTLTDMRKFMADRMKSVGPYPNASVGDPELPFGYVGPTPQIDFYITSSEEAKKELSLEKTGSVTDEKIGGIPAKVVQYPVEHDENGNPQPVLGAGGGKKYVLFLSTSEKALVIDKKALGKDDFEKDFDHLIQSLKFE